MKKWIRWTVVNISFLGLLTAGTSFGIGGAFNIVILLIVLMFIFSWTFLMPEVVESILINNPQYKTELFLNLDLAIDLLTLGILAWYGHFLLASMYVVHTILTQGSLRSKSEDLLKNNS